MRENQDEESRLDRFSGSFVEFGRERVWLAFFKMQDARMSGAGSALEYLCPGERHAISRSVHLARMAAGYNKCQVCNHRNEQGEIPVEVVRAELNPRRHNPAHWFFSEGLRAAFLNELSPQTATRIAEGFAEQLWAKQPPQYADRRDSPPVSELATSPGHPVVAIGHFESSRSLEFSSGISHALAQMGCQVIDLGEVRPPEFAFGLREINASGGLLLSAGPGPNLVDWMFFGAEGMPWSMPGSLDPLRWSLSQPVTRPVRRSERISVYSLRERYFQMLRSAAHEMEPVCCVVASPDAGLRQFLAEVFEPTAVRLVTRTASGPRLESMAELRSLSEFVVAQEARIGLVFSADGGLTHLVDATGDLLSGSRLTMRAADAMFSAHPHGTVVLDQAAAPELIRHIQHRGGHVSFSEPTFEAMCQRMRETAARLATTTTGHLWHAANQSLPDPALTLIQMAGSSPNR